MSKETCKMFTTCAMILLTQVTSTRVTTCQNTLKHTATHCNTLQHTATHCNKLNTTCHLIPVTGKHWFFWRKNNDSFDERAQKIKRHVVFPSLVNITHTGQVASVCVTTCQKSLRIFWCNTLQHAAHDVCVTTLQKSRVFHLGTVQRLITMSKETYEDVKRDIWRCQKRTMKMSKESYGSPWDSAETHEIVKRDIWRFQKRPIKMSKETYKGVKRYLLKCQKRPIKMSKELRIAPLETGWRRPTGSLILVSHFPQKSPILSGSFAKRNRQLKASCASSPPSSAWAGDRNIKMSKETYKVAKRDL